MTAAFISFFVTGVVGAALGIILFTFKKVAKKLFPSSWLYYMWAAVLLVMLIPLRITVPENPFEGTGIKEQAVSDNTVYTDKDDILYTDMTSGNVTEMTDFREKVLITNAKTKNENRLWDIISMVLPIISYTWLIIATAIFACRTVGYFIFLHHIKSRSKSVDLPQIRKYTTRKLDVRIYDKASSPLITGILHPMLILPSVQLTDEQLNCVLSHETVHLKRNDIIIKWLALIVKCVHFYNPAVYFICGQLFEECEISCDIRAVKNMDSKMLKNYVDTILMLASSKVQREYQLTTSMSSSKELLRKRFTGIKSSKKASILCVTVSVFVSAVMLCSGLLLSATANGMLYRDDTKQDITEIGYTSVKPCSGFINSTNSSYIDLYDESGKHVMSIPIAVASHFPTFDSSVGDTNLIFFCGKHGDFLWAFATTKGVFSSSHTNLCTSSDNGKSWYVESRMIGKGIVDKAWFTSEKEGCIVYSGGGYGMGVSRTHDGGITWEHFMENDYPLPLSKENALSLLKYQLILAYTRTYGEYITKEGDPGSMAGDKERLPYIIENLEITSDDGEYYRVPVIWDFLIEKETGFIYKFYDGLHKDLIYFDPYSPTALAFAG